MMTHYVNQFADIYDGEPWFGDSFKEKLKGINEKQAFARPAPEVHAVAELVSHCMYWRSPLIKRLQNDLTYKVSMESEENWLALEKLKEKGWSQLLKEFEANQKELIGLLLKAGNNFLQQEYRQGHKLDHLVEGVIQHDIYHLGQIGLVKKMLSV